MASVDELVSSHMRLAHSIAIEWAKKFPPLGDDFDSDACHGLLRAARYYDPSRAPTFAAFASLVMNRICALRLRRELRRLRKLRCHRQEIAEARTARPRKGERDPSASIDAQDAADCIFRRAGLTPRNRAMVELHLEGETVRAIADAAGLGESATSTAIINGMEVLAMQGQLLRLHERE